MTSKFKTKTIKTAAENTVSLQVSLTDPETSNTQVLKFPVSPAANNDNQIEIYSFSELLNSQPLSDLEMNGVIRTPIELNGLGSTEVVEFDSVRFDAFWDEMYQSVSHLFVQWLANKKFRDNVKTAVKLTPDITKILERWLTVIDEADRKKLLKGLFFEISVSQYMAVRKYNGKYYASLSIPFERISTVQLLFAGTRYSLHKAKFVSVTTRLLSKISKIAKPLSVPLVIIAPIGFNLFDEYQKDEFSFLSYLGVSFLDISVDFSAFALGASVAAGIGALLPEAVGGVVVISGLSVSVAATGLTLVIGSFGVALLAGMVLEVATSDLRNEISKNAPANAQSWEQSWQKIIWCMNHQSECVMSTVNPSGN